MYDVKDIRLFEYDFKKGICTITLKTNKQYNYRMSYEKFKDTYHNYVNKIYNKI